MLALFHCFPKRVCCVYHREKYFWILNLDLQKKPWLYLKYIFLCFQPDRRESRQTDGALYSAVKELWFFEGQAFLPYRQVFVHDFNSKVLTCQHVVLYSDGDMDHFFPRSFKWQWPNDMLGLWINPSMVSVRIFDHFICNTQHTNTNSLTISQFLYLYPTPSPLSSSISFVSIKIITCIYWPSQNNDILDTQNISLQLSPFS